MDKLAAVEGYQVFAREEYIKANVTSPSILSMNFQLEHGLINVVNDSNASTSDDIDNLEISYKNPLLSLRTHRRSDKEFI